MPFTSDGSWHNKVTSLSLCASQLCLFRLSQRDGRACMNRCQDKACGHKSGHAGGVRVQDESTVVD